MRRIGSTKQGGSAWLFSCKCGREVVTDASRVLSGHTKSCGCLRIEKLRCSSRVKHGDARARSATRLYRIWCGMKARCGNPNSPIYKHYGGRGISVCAEWGSYADFKIWATEAGYEDHLEIDRINNDGDYSPQNCRFVAKNVNASHKRNTVYLTINGETACAAEWSRRSGESKPTISKWVKKHGAAYAEAKIRDVIGGVHVYKLCVQQQRESVHGK